MKLFQRKVPILHHVSVGPLYFRMGLDFPELSAMARPGQFVMVKAGDGPIPLLRRPFSVHNLLFKDSERFGLEILYKVVGQGTAALSEMRAGDLLDVLGPLGNGFSYPEKAKSVFLVAGGVGVASLYYLALYLREQLAVTPTVFLGGCAASDILCRDEFASMGAKIQISTEDCSLGEVGFITSLVEKAIQQDGKPDMIYACGPQGMLKAVSDIGRTYDIRCQISVETFMACGFGVCLGCAVEKAREKGAYFHACTDGPVFDSRDVLIQLAQSASVYPSGSHS